jgi:hypothetical protein
MGYVVPSVIQTGIWEWIWAVEYLLRGMADRNLSYAQ